MAAHRRRKAVKPKVQKERKPGEPTKEQSCQTSRPACDQCIKAAVARGAREEDVKCHYSAASIYAKHGDSEFEARLGGREAKCDWGEKRKESVEAFEPKKEEEVVKVAMRPRMGGKTLPGVSERKDLLNQSSFPSDFSPSYLPTDHSLFSLSATLALRPPIPPWARAATLPLFSPSSCGLNPPYVATTASFWDGGPLSPDEVRGWEGLKYAAVQSGIRGGV
ncbi:hypothetical protein JCM8097_007153 [Rhodosporidiobolus ruineniae]